MKKHTLVAFTLLATHFIYSQETLPASGGEATGSGGTSSYSIGQLIYSAYTGSNGSVIQGVQQNIELFTLSNPELTALTLTAVMYPNPTTDYVVLELKDSNLTDLSYTMYDLQGREVAKGKVQQEDTPIAMQVLATGTYILKINQKNNELKTFKIIKN